MRQEKMFQTQDLPLFSGTAPRAQVEPFEPQPDPYQPPLFDHPCAICLGFGAVKANGKLKRCICNK